MLRLRVKEVAQRKGLNISQLQRKSDLSYNTVRELWHNPFKEVSTETLNKIARALDVPVTDLIEDVPEE